jgi:hypothetical protein
VRVAGQACVAPVATCLRPVMLVYFYLQLRLPFLWRTAEALVVVEDWSRPAELSCQMSCVPAVVQTKYC